jgi:nicotinamide-nucleotide amidase
MSPKIEIINTGSELLLGNVTNTHLTFLGQELASLGLSIDRQVTVPDGDAIREALKEAMDRANVIIVTGGLGPTSDDLTRDIAAELLKRPLKLDQEILDKIESYFVKRKLKPTDTIRVQAMVPEGATVLPNNCGTAPGLILEEKNCAFILLPGPPRELKPMWKESVIPWLKQKFSDRPKTYQNIWRLLGIGESLVQQTIEADVRALGNFEVGYCARSGEVDLRISTLDEKAFKKAGALIEEKFRNLIYAEGSETMESIVIRHATEKKRKIATAESCTGGLIAHRLTNVPGSSAVFEYGWVTYGNNAKESELQIDPQILEKHGAVSEETAKAMATGALKTSQASVAVAVTGIAGPDGGTAEKPVGLVWIALATEKNVIAVKNNLSTDRETFKYRVSQIALDLIRRELTL